MKTRTKITVTLAVGIGLLIGSMGVASASPHYSDWNGRPSFKAPVSSYTAIEWTLKAPVSSWREDGAGRLHENRSGLHDSVHCLRNGTGKSTATLNRGYSKAFRECSAL